MTIRRLVAGSAIALATASAADTSAPRETAIRFELPAAATTSAGVYDRAGRLVRTLWRAEPLSTGPHRRTWDGRDDLGRALPLDDYGVTLIHHRVRAVWEGVVGNSSDAFGGAATHKAFLPPHSLVIEGDTAHYAVGYNEAQPGLHGFALASPGRAVRRFASTDPFAAFAMVATDGQRLFAVNIGGLSKTSFVQAFDLRTTEPVVFPSGRAICLNRRPASDACYESQSYRSVLDLQVDEAERPTGIAVQRNGRILAVAHGGRNVVRLFDKTSGAPIREIAVPLAAQGLNQLAMSAAGDLWVVGRGGQVVRLDGLEREPAVRASVEGLARPLALASGPKSDDVWVADGGPSQQVKRFDRDGKALGVLARSGGYAADPEVRADKLCFRFQEGREQTALAVATDGALWVVDTCNNRVLRFPPDPAREADPQLAYLPATYAATVDLRDPRRVFANFLEFEVDASTPLVAGRSWRLVRNWLAGLPSTLADDRTFNGQWGGFTSVVTLRDGRTIAMLPGNGRQTIVELPRTGPLRIVRALAKPPANTTAQVLDANGDLSYALTGTRTQTVFRLPLTGTDDRGSPDWSQDPVRLATVPLDAGSPYDRGAFSGTPPRFPVTASGKVVFFDPSVVGNEGFHLGAAELGATAWSWQASPTGALDGKGSFQTKRVDGSVHYGGNAVWAEGRHIVFGYHGEFHKDLGNGKVGQANQFMHFLDNGLFVGQFGVASTRATTGTEPGLSGNAFSPTLVRSGERLYLYHNDESSHAGVHRWRLDGADGVRELKGAGPMGGEIVLR